jgi:hypothetical protein
MRGYPTSPATTPVKGNSVSCKSNEVEEVAPVPTTTTTESTAKKSLQQSMEAQSTNIPKKLDVVQINTQVSSSGKFYVF